MVCTCASQEVRHQSSSLCDPLFVARLRLEGVNHLRVFVVVGGVSPGRRGHRFGVVSALFLLRRLAVADTVAAGVAVGFGHAIAVAISHRGLVEHASDIDAAAEAHALGQTRTGRSRDALEGISTGVSGTPVKRCTRLVVGQIRLSRVGK